jgi:hypothetical protein
MEYVYQIKIESGIQHGQREESQEEKPQEGPENAANIETSGCLGKTGRGKVKPLPKRRLRRDIAHPPLAASSDQPNPSSEERSTEQAYKELSRDVPEYRVLEFRTQCHSI